ncbi:uncharacterized protein LOC108243931 [Kryptolebias marmoratus]|uniref:Uncharacterized LOC108243931 n=1 Tax=Kryptolebias marmoratus TaxID=37003 RepID=A0A3Q3BSA0_KRYMA|nr:uncharacterized protein LOC108243931 [Kryptolebias marmoratus]
MMNLWLSCLLLFASLFLSSSAPTPEECQNLVKPLSLADPSVMYGRMNFLVGYADHEVYKAILKVTDSSWVKVSASPTSATEIVVSQENKINGTCFSSTVKGTVEGDTVNSSIANTTSVFHVLPSCEGCLALSINSTAKNIQNLLKAMKFSDISMADEFHIRALYLLGPETTLKDSDLEHFKKQASCLGFSAELDFHYNPEKSFCQEGEGIRMPYSQ